ncbi:MAG: nucleolar RNA-binding Nop10p family protein [Thermoplasmatota archaeon]
MSQILYCKTCKTYTLDYICARCKKPTIIKKPARYSPQDRLGKYRRELKKSNIKNG